MKKMLVVFSCLFVQSSFAQAVFQSYDLIVSDPAAVVAAMDKYQSSPTGQANTATVILYQYVAAGDNMATHAVNVVHSSPEEMDANLARNQASQDQATFLAEISPIAEVTSRWMGQILLSGGDPNNITSANPASIAYFISVSDPVAYAQAFTKFTERNSDVGQSFLSTMTVDGDNPATHVALNNGNSLGELFMNQPQMLDGWDDFANETGQIRTIESVAAFTVVKRWDP